MRPPVRLVVALLVAVLVVALAGCSTDQPDPPDAAEPPRSDPPREQPRDARAETTGPTEPGDPAEPEPPPEPGSTPPPWLGTRVLPEGPDGYGVAGRTPTALRTRAFTLPDALPPLPGRGFASRVDPVPDRVLARSTWQPACPVGRDDLAWVRVAFRGFDGGRHTGELLVDRRVAGDLVAVFRDLWRARFPLEELRITTRAELEAPPTGDGNNTGAFVCRPVTGGTTYSEHAFGLAVDVNPFQNPYVRDDLVLPELAAAYVDRDRRAPGMVLPGGPVVRAFAAIGWQWGGDYRSLKDWQHFSLTGG